MQIVELWQYPVKAFAGSSGAAAMPAARGFVDDRRWMLVDERGRFLSQREHARLARWRAEVRGDDLLLTDLDAGTQLTVPDARAEDGPPLDVTIWDDRCTARLVTSVAAAELSETLGLRCRLVYMAEDTERPLPLKYNAGGETVSFADGYPYLIVNRASLTALSEAVGRPLDMRRFRPNIVVEGTPAFAEDDWKGLRIGDQLFHIVKPCARCVVITLDPETLEKDMRVFATLARLHGAEKKVLFGMNACWEGKAGGEVRVGEAVVTSL